MHSQQSNSPIWLLLTLVITPFQSLVALAEPVEVTTIATGLTSPLGIAIRPGGGRSGDDLFVADSGAMRIVSTSSTKEDGEWSEVVTGFSGSDDAEGPQGITFLSRNTLLVTGEGRVRGYDVSADDLPVGANETKYKLSSTPKLMGNRLGIARIAGAVFVASGGSEKMDGVFRATISATRLSKFQHFADSSGASGMRAIAFNKKGYMVVSQIVGNDEALRSQLVFLNPFDAAAEPVLILKTSLHEIVAIAYSPETGNLFAAEFSESNPDGAGIYRIDARRNESDARRHETTGDGGCEAVLVARVDQPTAIAFAGDGTLYVTSAGEQAGDGQLLKLNEKL